jgi:hypothetical protein
MYAHDAELRQVVIALSRAGIPKEDICMMVSPSHPIAISVREAGFVGSERESTASNAGLIGWLSEFGAVVIPTVGLFIRSQSFFRDLVLGNHSAALCGRLRSLLGLGFSENEAERVETQFRAAGAMVYVTCPENAGAASALELLRRTGASSTAALEREAAAGAATCREESWFVPGL